MICEHQKFSFAFLNVIYILYLYYFLIIMFDVKNEVLIFEEVFTLNL